MTRRLIILASLCLALPIMTAAKTQAQTATLKIGVLTCTGGAGIGLIIGSQKNMSCQFQPSSAGPAEHYGATLTKIGLDIGITGATTMVWTVLAPSSKIAPRALAGNYIGASADAALGIGGGGKVLVGGSNKSITLQPLSLQGQTGLNLAVGIAEFKLQ